MKITLHRIHNAGKNRKLLVFTYNNEVRLVEGYSIRTRSPGNVLYYGWEHTRGSTVTKTMKCFRVDGMQNVNVTNRNYVPRHTVEFR